MSDKVKVSRVEIEMGGDKKMLTIEQAKRLRDQLNELFGVKVEEHHHHHHDRYWWWQGPTYKTGTTLDAPPELPKVWCHSSSLDDWQLANGEREYTATLKC